MTKVLLCRDAHRSDIDRIVTIHLQSFKGFFLTSLGTRFLTEMYKSFMLDRKYIFVVAEDAGEVVGFSVGVSNEFSFGSSLTIGKKIKLFLSMMPSLVKNIPILLPKVVSRYRAKDTYLHVPDNTIFLKSIGILPESQGTGVAQTLLSYFEQQSLMLGYNTVLLTTDALDNNRVINFYKKCGYFHAQSLTQDNNREMLVLTKDIRKLYE